MLPTAPSWGVGLQSLWEKSPSRHRKEMDVDAAWQAVEAQSFFARAALVLPTEKEGINCVPDTCFFHPI